MAIRLASARRISASISPRQLGPFKILAKIGDLDYKLELPNWLKIHPVFHVNKLSPWHDQGVKKPAPPKPVKVAGEERYVVEKVIDSRIYRRQLQYKVRWKGYGQGDDTWQTADDLKGAKALVNKFHRENPEAPRKLAATAFEALATCFRPFVTEVDVSLLSAADRAKADLAWEEGRCI